MIDYEGVRLGVLPSYLLAESKRGGTPYLPNLDKKKPWL